MPTIKQEYDKLVKHLEKNVFHSNQQTSDDQLNTICHKLLGPEFGGVYAEDDKIPLDSEHKYFIVNTDKHNEAGTHWCGILKDSETKKLYIFDSFDRQISKLLHDVDVNAKKQHFTVSKGSHTIDQKDDQEDCGQRSTGWLVMVKKHGIDAVRKGL